MRQSKEKCWEEFGNEVEENYQHNPRKFWQIVKSLKGKFGKRVKSVADETGKIVTDGKDVLKVWRNHFAATFGHQELVERTVVDPNPQIGGNGEEIMRVEV